MVKLIAWKVDNSKKFIDLITNTTGSPDFELFVKIMKMKSGYPNNLMTKDTIEMIRGLWSHCSPEDQSHWAKGFEFAHASYFDWLSFLHEQISSSTHPTIKAFLPLIPEMLTRVTKI